jgi:hypothetical protein
LDRDASGPIQWFARSIHVLSVACKQKPSDHPRSLDVATDSADVARISADAAKLSAEVAKNSLTVLERPYLYAVDLALGIPDDFNIPTLRPGAGLAFQNFGRTPAILKELWLLLEIGTTAPAQLIARGELPASYAIGAGGSTVTLSTSYDSPFSVGVKGQIARGDLFFWFACKVCYEDMFGERYELKSTWRYSSTRRRFEPV